MKIKAIASNPKSPKGSVSTFHFRIERPDKTYAIYDIGPEPVEVPDADALECMNRIRFVVEAEEEPESKPRGRPKKK